MPIYEYRCCDCAQLFEEWQKDFQDREVPCPVCGGKSERLISNTSFILKGGGWYVTDYCRGSSKASAAPPAKEGAAKDNGGSEKESAPKADSPKAEPVANPSASPPAAKDHASSKIS